MATTMNNTITPMTRIMIGFQQRRKPRNDPIDFSVVNLTDPPQHLFHFTASFTDSDHVRDQRRKFSAALQWLRNGFPFANILSGLFDRLLQNAIVHDPLRDIHGIQ